MEKIGPFEQHIRATMERWMNVLSLTTKLTGWSDEPVEKGVPDVLWVSINTPDATRTGANRAVDTRVYAALELLTLLGEIDFMVWADMMVLAWPKAAPAWVEAANGRVLRLGCSLSFANRDTTRPIAPIDKWCERAIAGPLESDTQLAYALLRWFLEKANKAREAADDGQRSLPRDQLHIPLRIQSCQGDYVDRVRQIVQLVALHQVRDSSAVSVLQNPDWKPLFRLATVDIPPEQKPLSTTTFLSIAQIVGFGVNMRAVAFAGIEIMNETAAMFTTGLQVMLRTPIVSSPEKQITGGVADVGISANMSRRTCAAIYSALQTSQSVGAVSINITLPHQGPDPIASLSPADIQHLWRWIALAVFSSHASHHLHHVSLTVDRLRTQDVAAMQELLEHEDPEVLLFGGDDDSGSASRSSSHFISASRFHLLPHEPVGLAEMYRTTIELPLQEVRVLGGFSPRDDRVRVLLPGTGEAWVERGDILEHRIESVAAVKIRPVPGVILVGITNESKQAVLSLLQLIGHGITDLAIVYNTCDDPLDDWIRDVILACPLLEALKLTLGTGIETLDTFTQMYERGECRMRRLDITHLLLRDPASATRFARTLADTTHVMAQQLQNLSIFMYSVEEPLPGLTDAVHKLLNENHVLHSLRLFVTFRTQVPPSDLLSITSRVNEEVKKPVTGRALPLNLHAKLAFLSVINPKARTNSSQRRSMEHHETHSTQQQQQQQQRMGRLDRGVVSLIFQFAARSRTRRVRIRLSNERNEQE